MALFALIFFAWLIGGFISGLVGQGGVLFAVPMASLAINMQDVILISCLLNVVMDAGIVALHAKFCLPKALIPLWLGAVPGSILGLYVLLLVPEKALRILVGASILLFLCWQKKTLPKRKDSFGLATLAGFLSGLFGSALSFDGPPVGAYALYAGWAPREVLGTLGVYFLARGLFTVLLQWQANLYTDFVVTCALWGIPATLLGTLIAYPLTKRMRLKTLNQILPWVLGLGALACMLEAVL